MGFIEHARVGSATLLLASLLCSTAGAEEATPDGARVLAAFEGDDARLEARLLIDPRGSLDGRSQRVGVHLRLDPGWHLYWRNPGESGLPTRVSWRVDRARIGATLWPAPVAFVEPELDGPSYGYADEVLLMADVFPEPGEPAQRHVQVDLDLLVCNSSCIPARFKLERALLPGEPGPDEALFREFEARLPQDARRAGVELPESWSLEAVRPGDEFEIELALPPGASAEFFPYLLQGVELSAAESGPRRDGQPGELLRLRGVANEQDPEHDQTLAGVLRLNAADGTSRALELELPLRRARAGTAIAANAAAPNAPAAARVDPASAAAAPGSQLGAWQALLLAFLGGLILNLMPCVLPVLAIKVVSIAELAQHGRRGAAAQGVAYACGVLAAMALLASAVCLLRAAGHAVGWGFQFQEPAFLVFLCTVLVVFAANLLGVFEIGAQGGALAQLGAQATGARRSFFDGLLAAVLATPCSAPFLGTAVGFAFAGSTALVFAVFGAIGAGLASPFLAITLLPGAARLLPRPGAWMLRLRSVLGFALLGTAVWLLWVLGRSSGVDALIGTLALLTAVAFLCWLYGVAQHEERFRLGLGALGAVVLLTATGLGTVGAVRLDAGAQREVQRVFDRAQVAAELARGRPVFVYFTADWCVTCAANERLVLADARVQHELAKLDFAIFKADWTRRDDAIRSELARYGRAGVPLYLVFKPDAPDAPLLLPELLSVDVFLATLRRASPSV